MDEYLFIALAKLKADRLRLEREQRAQALTEEQLFREPVETHRSSVRTGWFSREPQLRGQS